MDAKPSSQAFPDMSQKQLHMVRIVNEAFSTTQAAQVGITAVSLPLGKGTRKCPCVHASDSLPPAGAIRQILASNFGLLQRSINSLIY